MQVMVGNNYGSYTFNAATGVITFSGLPYPLAAGQVKLIVNTMTNTSIFNLLDPTQKATYSGNTITLSYNTSAMSDSDPLQIYMDVPAEYVPQAVVGTFYQATQPVSVSNFPSSQHVTVDNPTTSISVSNLPSTQAVTGTVDVGNFPSTQAVTGTFWQGTQPVSGSVSVNNLPTTQSVTFPSAQHVIVDSGDATQYTAGATAATPTGTVALGKNSSNVLEALSLDSSGNLNVNVQVGGGSGSGGNVTIISPVDGSGNVKVAVENSIAVTGTFWQTTQPVSGTVGISGTVPVSGTFYQATQPVSGTVTANISGSISNTAFGVTGDVAIVNSTTSGKTKLAVTADPVTFASPQHVIVDSATLGTVAVSGTFWQATQPVSSTQLPAALDGSGNLKVAVENTSLAVTGTFWQATQPVSGSVSVSNFPATQAVSWSGQSVGITGTVPVSGTFWQATQPVSGSVSVSNFPATQPVSGTVSVSGTVPVSGTFWQTTQPVSGTVTSNQGTALVGAKWSVQVDNASAIAVADSAAETYLGNISGAVDSGQMIVSVNNASIPVTGTFWQATQPVSGTVVAQLEDGSGNPISSTGGALNVNVSGGANTQYTDGAAAATPTGTVAMGQWAGTVQALQTDPFGNLSISFGKNTDMFGDLVASPRWAQFECNFSGGQLDNSLITPTGTGTISFANGGASIATTTATSTSENMTSTVTLEYRVAHEWFCYMTASFTTGVAGSHQRIGLFNGSPANPQDGFFIGYEGTTFGITQFQNFVGQGSFATEAAPSIAHSAMNGDPLDGTSASLFTSSGSPVVWNPTNINLYRIRGGWLGTGVCVLEILSPDGNWVVMHTYRFPNTLPTAYTYTTTWNYQAEVLNTTNTSNIVMYMGGASFGSTDPTYRMTDTMSNTTLAQTTRSAMFGQYNSTPSTITSGNFGALQVDINGNLKTTSIDGTILDTQTSITSTGAGATYTVAGYGYLSFQFGGNWAGFIRIEASNDGVNWIQQYVQYLGTGYITDVVSIPTIVQVAAASVYMRYYVISLDMGVITVKVVGNTGTIPTTSLLGLAFDLNSGVQLNTNIANIKTDTIGGLLSSDAPAPILISGGIGQPNLIVDTQGYESLNITTETLAATVTCSNAKVTWSALSGAPLVLGALTTSVAAATGYSFPCIARYIRFVPTAAGTATVYLRSQPWSGTYTTSVPTSTASNNLAQIGATTVVSGGVAGTLAVGGNVAVGSAQTNNPIVVGGVDTSNLTRRLQTDASGRPIIASIDQANITRALGTISPNNNAQNLPALAVQDLAQFEGQSLVDLMAQILIELRILNYYNYNLPTLLTTGLTNSTGDEPAALRNDPVISTVFG